MQQPTVLIVDDKPSNLDLLREILDDDYRVRVATNGEKALELAARDPLPDIILLDIMMPGMDGYEVCQKLKQHPDTTPIPVIFVTAMAQVEDEQRGLALGAVDYITKPYNPEIVKARVRTHLSQYQMTQRLIAKSRVLQDIEGSSFTDFDRQLLAYLLQQGEDHRLEFQSTLRCDLDSGEFDKSVENGCLTTVASYLNTEGGILLVGVNDDGEVLGLGNDKFETEDELLLHWVNLLKSYLGAEFIPFIRSIVHDLDGARVLVVECLPSTKPAFFRRDDEGSFFVRITSSTQALTPNETLGYIEEHFGSKQTEAAAASDAEMQADRIQQEADAGFAGWIGQLHKRRVFRTAALYLASAWLVTEAGTTVAKTLEAPSWVPLVLVYVFIGGFPLVILLSWVYDLRIVRPGQSMSRKGARIVTWLIIGIILVSAAIISRLATSGG